MWTHHSTRMHSPFKNVLRKIGDKYQAYYTTYKAHAMATCHGGAACPLDRDIDLHIEEAMGIDNDDVSTHGSDATVALGGPEAEGHPNDPIYNNQDKLMELMREINDLHQWVEAEGQPAESLDCIEHEIQNLSIVLHPPPSPTPTVPFREVICQDKHLVHHTETNKPNQLITTGHRCFQWLRLYKIGKMANRHRDNSRSNKWKSGKASQSKIKGINTHIHWSLKPSTLTCFGTK